MSLPPSMLCQEDGPPLLRHEQGPAGLVRALDCGLELQGVATHQHHPTAGGVAPPCRAALAARHVPAAQLAAKLSPASWPSSPERCRASGLWCWSGVRRLRSWWRWARCRPPRRPSSASTSCLVLRAPLPSRGSSSSATALFSSSSSAAALQGLQPPSNRRPLALRQALGALPHLVQLSWFEWSLAQLPALAPLAPQLTALSLITLRDESSEHWDNHTTAAGSSPTCARCGSSQPRAPRSARRHARRPVADADCRAGAVEGASCMLLLFCQIS
jgi:hypothetical protein